MDKKLIRTAIDDARYFLNVIEDTISDEDNDLSENDLSKARDAVDQINAQTSVLEMELGV